MTLQISVKGSSEASNGNQPKSPRCEPSWQDKEIQLPQIPSYISNGNSVYIGSCASTAEASLREIVEAPLLANIRIIQLIPGGELPHKRQTVDRFRTYSFYTVHHGLFNETNGGECLEDYNPMSIREVPRLLQKERLTVDVAVIKVTPPHKGYVSLGMGVDMTVDMVRHAHTVIAEVNPAMPWTEGQQSKLPISAIDYWVSRDEPLLTTEQLWPQIFEGPRWPQSVVEPMARNVCQEIPNGSTVRFGISALLHNVVPWLKDHQDLGLHTDVFFESMYELHVKGVFTNRFKTIDTGRTVVSQAHGSQAMYDFCNRNPAIEFHPCSYVTNPQVLANIDNLVSIVGALKVDLTGQVATDSIAHKFYGGIFADDDSIRGARFSKGGKAIVCLPSVSISGRSNIVFALPLGTGVTITRSDVEFVVTEYGTASLYGRSIRERCLSLIDIAHPSFRKELLEEAKKHHFVSKQQPGRSLSVVYPSQWQCTHTTRSGKDVLVRPIKMTDEDGLRAFFHKLSDHSVYLRYFRKLRSMPQRILQRTADIDYSTDMAIVVLSPPDQFDNEIVGIAQWNSDIHVPSYPEVAFQVRDDWQGEGLGTYLFHKILEIAKTTGIEKVKADVLADNKAMNTLVEKSGYKYIRRSDFGVFSYEIRLKEESHNACI